MSPLSTVKDLYINHDDDCELIWGNCDIENLNDMWLGLFLPFTAVENRYISKESVPGIAASLQELVESRIVGVLPSLEDLLVAMFKSSGPFWKNIRQFDTARQLSGHPVAICLGNNLVWNEREK